MVKHKIVSKTMAIGKEPERKVQGNERGVQNGKPYRLKELLAFSGSHSLSGYADFGGLSEEEVTERIRMEHYGY